MKTDINITHRWESGTPHHPKSEALFEFVSEADFKLASDYFCFKSGGDGDNGEHLMYLMDIYFDAIDNGELDKVRRAVEAKVVTPADKK